MVKIKNKISSCFFLVALVCLSADRPKLVKIKVNESITVFVPKEWRPMDEMDMVQRYPSVRAPIAAFTNNERVADFSINVSATQWPDDNVALAQQFFKAGIMNVFDRVEFIDEGIHDLRGKKFIFFEFRSRVNGNRHQEGYTDPVLRYTYIQYLIEPGKALVFSFSCPVRQREELQETAREMMMGIRVK
jgi:hypothetical protein